MSKRRALHLTAGIASLLIQAAPSWAENGVAIYPVPPAPPPAVVDEAAHELGNPLNLAYPVRCQLRSRVSPAAAVEFFIRGG